MYRRDALPSERHEAARHARIVAVRCIRRAVSIDDLTLRHLRGSAIMFWHQCQEMLAEIGFPAAVAGWICTHQCLVCLRHYDWPPQSIDSLRRGATRGHPLCAVVEGSHAWGVYCRGEG